MMRRAVFLSLVAFAISNSGCKTRSEAKLSAEPGDAAASEVPLGYREAFIQSIADDWAIYARIAEDVRAGQGVGLVEGREPTGEAPSRIDLAEFNERLDAFDTSLIDANKQEIDRLLRASADLLKEGKKEDAIARRNEAAALVEETNDLIDKYQARLKEEARVRALAAAIPEDQNGEHVICSAQVSIEVGLTQYSRESAQQIHADLSQFPTRLVPVGTFAAAAFDFEGPSAQDRQSIAAKRLNAVVASLPNVAGAENRFDDLPTGYAKGYYIGTSYVFWTAKYETEKYVRYGQLGKWVSGKPTCKSTKDTRMAVLNQVLPGPTFPFDRDFEKQAPGWIEAISKGVPPLPFERQPRKIYCYLVVARELPNITGEFYGSSKFEDRSGLLSLFWKRKTQTSSFHGTINTVYLQAPDKVVHEYQVDNDGSEPNSMAFQQTACQNAQREFYPGRVTFDAMTCGCASQRVVPVDLLSRVAIYEY